jgi:hypothetical protein
MPSNIEYDLKFLRYFRFGTFDPGVDWSLVREAGLPNTPLLERIPSFDNFDPLQPWRTIAFREALEGLSPERQDRLLRLVDVGWRAVADPDEADGVRYVAVEGATRARLFPAARWALSAEEALQIVMGEDFDPESEVVLEGTPPAGVPPAGSGGTTGIALREQRPDRVLLFAQSAGGGWLVLSDAYYPGWQARVDGSLTTIYPADAFLRAVWVPAGYHLIEFHYSPAVAQVGALISLLGWAFVAVAGVKWRRA